jgi:two-component system phosphate regulon sensor histidine kinase PhoR
LADLLDSGSAPVAREPPAKRLVDATRSARLARRALVAGAAGAAALFAYFVAAFQGHADAQGVAAGALTAAAAAALALWLVERTEPAPARAGVAPAGETPEPPYALALEGLSDPVLLVASGPIQELSEPRLLFANVAARRLLRVARQGGLLAASIRNPMVLEALEEALYGRIEASAVFEEGGALERTWRATAKPLVTEAGNTLALLWLRDETDAMRNERMRADFLANASHELRTPLASLTGFIETLRGHAKEDPAARDRFLAIMTQQAERMSRLIDDLLSLSRIELNEHIPPSGAVDLSLAATDVLDALGPLVANRRVSLDVRLPPAGEAVITGDRDQVIQVIQNLVDNAIKYAGPDGVVTVEVLPPAPTEALSVTRTASAARLSLLSPDRAPGRRYAALRVSDSGPGIAREHLPRLSERFYRVEGQTGGQAGTGLGLAIVKHIVNRHRGGLAVESAEGQGATFTAYLPAARPRDVADETQSL